jgi:Aerotolerance regulator N-terminal/von Willebrand factor type A domain
MPGFANLPLAALAAAIAVPALLLLYFLKLRRKEMPVSSTLLWRKTIEDLQVNAPFQRLRKNLLLLLQLLLLLLLCLALARPLHNAGTGLGKKTVLLIDHSASMNAHEASGITRLDQAKRRAAELVREMGSDSQAMVIAFADDAQVMQAFTSDRAALRTAIDGIQPTDRRTKLEMAYKLADAQGADSEVWLFSDGRAADADHAKPRGVLHDEKIGAIQTDNVGIIAMDARRNYDDPTQVQVFVHLANFGGEPVSADAQLSVAPIDGGPLRWQVVRVASTYLLPEAWTAEQRQAAMKGQNIKVRDSVEFDLPLTDGAAVRVQQMHADALAADDTATVIVPPPRQLRALLVTDGNYFLEKAIKSLELRDPAMVTPNQYEASWSDTKNNPGQYDVIVFDAYVPKRLPAAGNFIWFASLPPGIGVTANKSGNEFARVQDQRFLDWQTDHPILRGLSLQSVTLRDTLNLHLSANAQVLAQGVKGPLIVLDRENRQTHLIIGFDLWQSDWPEHVSFPIFMRNAMQYMALGTQTNVEASFEPGDTPRISRSILGKLGDVKELSLHTPDGQKTIKVPATGDIVLPPLEKVGIYSTQPAVPGLEQMAVNLVDENESNLNPISLSGGTSASVATTNERGQSDLWRWLIACGALPLLLIEWWVYSRRMHM